MRSPTQQPSRLVTDRLDGIKDAVDQGRLGHALGGDTSDKRLCISRHVSVGEEQANRREAVVVLVKYRSEMVITDPWSPSSPPFLPPTDLVKPTAPPLTDTALSIPLGFPCRTFSDKNAQPSISSVSLAEICGPDVGLLDRLLEAEEEPEAGKVM